MDLNLKIEHARKLMDKLHERNKRQGEDLAKLCELLCDITQEHGVKNGADAGVVALAVAPKDD